MAHELGTTEDLTILKETQNHMNEKINDENNVRHISTTLMEVQQEKMTTNDSDGDGLKLNSETKTKLESIEKKFNDLTAKNICLKNQVKNLHTNKLDCDQMISIKTELNEVKVNIDEMRIRKAIKEKENFQNFQILINKTTEIDNRITHFILEMKNLKTMVENACQNKCIMRDIMQLLEYIKKQHCENQIHFDERTSKYKDEINQLKADVDMKRTEIETLEGCAVDRNSIQLVQDFITNKLSVLIQYVTELEVTNANQNKIILELNTQENSEEEVNKPMETKDLEEMIKLLDNECKQQIKIISN